MLTIEINSVADFHKQVEKTYKFHALFRGESKATWKLLSKFGRHAATNIKNTIHTERSSLLEFKRLSLPHISYEPKDEWEWLSLAQHHGLATRLLDWTINPLVAAYFSSQMPYHEDSVIYVFDEYSLEQNNVNTDPFLLENNVVYRPRHTNHRMTAQSGIFTAHSDPQKPFENKTLQRWVIKSEMVIPLKTMTDVYGVNQSTIFPGIDSICHDIHERLVWN